MIKDVVVNLSGRGPQGFAADYAVSLGAAFKAHLVGLAFVYDPVIPEGTMGGIPVDVIELQREENSKGARAAVERFETSAKAAGVSAETRMLDASIGSGATVFGSIARRFDLAVVGQSQREHGASEELLIEAALFESGRPLLLVPYIQRSGLTLDRVIVCWDGGRTAARAIADAMRTMLTPGQAGEWKARSLKRAAEFSWERAAKETREVYEEARRRFE